MKTCVLALTAEGKQLARCIAEALPGCRLHTVDGRVADAVREVWTEFGGIICVMAAGIVVRSIAPLLADKTTDPCVVVIDQKGQHAISLLSGHLGGGNDLACRVAAITGGCPVITTASDVMSRTALDLWAKRHNLHITDRSRLTEKSAMLVNGAVLRVYSNLPLMGLPADFAACSSADEADLVITSNKFMTLSGLWCIPEILYVGVGCNRGTPAADIEQSFAELCEQHGIARQGVAGVATIDIKHDEHGILRFAQNHGVEPCFFAREVLNSVADVSFSEAAMKAVGVQGVAEPAALLAARADGSEAELIVRKMKWKDVTLAVAERKKSRWD